MKHPIQFFLLLFPLLAFLLAGEAAAHHIEGGSIPSTTVTVSRAAQRRLLRLGKRPKQKQSQPALHVALSARNPLGDVIARGATHVPALTVDLTASCAGNVFVESIAVMQRGQGPPADIAGLSLWSGNERVSRAHIPDEKTRKAVLRFREPLFLKACATASLTIFADFTLSARTGDRHAFMIGKADDVFVRGGGEVGGTFPLAGETFEMGSEPAGGVTLTYADVPEESVDSDRREVVIGALTISAGDTEDQTLSTLTLRNAGTAHDGDVTALFLRRSDGARLTTIIPEFTDDHAPFLFDPPYTVHAGEAVALELVADIINGAGRSVRVQMEEGSDLFATGSRHGYGVSGQLYGSPVRSDGAPATVRIIEPLEE